MPTGQPAPERRPFPGGWQVPGCPGCEAGKYRQPAGSLAAGDAWPWRKPEVLILGKNKGGYLGGPWWKRRLMQEAECSAPGREPESPEHTPHPPGASFQSAGEDPLHVALGSFPFPAQSSWPTPQLPEDGWSPTAQASRCRVLLICTEWIFGTTEGSRALQHEWIPPARRHRLLPTACLGRAAASCGAQVRL